MTTKHQIVGFGPLISELLAACNLPITDLSVVSPIRFLVAQKDGRLAGVVGLELYGPVALLGSLAVPELSRGRGLGKGLLAAMEEYADSHQVRRIYLLTTTAESYFANQGYERVDRSAAPREISSTSQFASLCPQTAVLMLKQIVIG